MRTGGAAAAILLWGALGAGCEAGPGVAGVARPWPMPGLGTPSGDDPVPSPDERVRPHQGYILTAMNLAAVYIGYEGVDGVGTRDDFLSWVVASNGYWTRLAQYGVGLGALLGSARVASAAFFTADELAAGRVSESQLADAVLSYSPNLRADANAVIFFMPTSIGLTTTRGPQLNCAALSGYHDSLSGAAGPPLPYAVVFPCPNFPPDMPTSHELVEMATDPFAAGWYDPQTGAEIGDLCNFPVSQPLDLWSPSRFWSNADGGCVPP